MNAILMMPVKLAILRSPQNNCLKTFDINDQCTGPFMFYSFCYHISILLYNIIWFYYCIGIVAVVFLILNERMTHNSMNMTT